MEGRHLCQNVRVSGYKTRERREQLCVCERERGAPARGVCAWVSDTEGRAGRPAGGRGQPARGGSVPAWSGPIRSCVSEGIQSGGRAGCALRRERRQHGASSGRRAAQAAAPARPALRAAGAATAAAPPPATAPPIAVPRPGTERPALRTEVSPGLPAAAARDPQSSLPARRAGAGMRGSGGRGGACAAGTEARPGPRVPQPGPPSPRRLPGALGVAPARRRRGLAARTGRGGHRPSFLRPARAKERAGGRRRRVGRTFARLGRACGRRAQTWTRPPRI